VATARAPAAAHTLATAWAPAITHTLITTRTVPPGLRPPDCSPRLWPPPRGGLPAPWAPHDV